MENAFAYVVAILFFVIALNFLMMFRRLKRDFPRKRKTVAILEREAAEIRDMTIQRRLERENEEAERYIELRNKTFELYEQVRQNAAAAEREKETHDQETV